MRFYKVDMQGPFLNQLLAAAPGYTASDEGRLLYDQAQDQLYYGCAKGGVAAYMPIFDAAHDLQPETGSTYKIGDVGGTYLEIHSDDFYGQVRYS